MQLSTLSLPPDSLWQNEENILPKCAQSADKNSKNNFNANYAHRYSAKGAAIDKESFLLYQKTSDYVANSAIGSLSNSSTIKYECYDLRISTKRNKNLEMSFILLEIRPLKSNRSMNKNKKKSRIGKMKKEIRKSRKRRWRLGFKMKRRS